MSEQVLVRRICSWTSLKLGKKYIYYLRKSVLARTQAPPFYMYVATFKFVIVHSRMLECLEAKSSTPTVHSMVLKIINTTALKFLFT